MATIMVKDENGKEFTFDDINITKFNGDISDGKENSSISDGVLRNRVQDIHNVEFVNANDQAIDSSQLLKDMESGKIKVIALDVNLEATHSGPNHNYCIYYEDSMEKDAESFTNPFHKPMLKNHDSHSEPLGRIIHAYGGESIFTDERSAIHLDVHVTDKDAIPKFIDGRYKTVSIGGSMGTVTCNICGKTILKDGKFKFCGHWRGETYKDRICYWGAKDIEYHEVSTVNNPADDFAQVVKIKVITDKDNESTNKNDGHDNKEEETNMDGQNNNEETVLDEKTKKSIIDLIDSVIKEKKEEQESQETQDGTHEEEHQEENQEDETVESLKKKLEDTNKKLEDTKKLLEDSQKIIKDKEKEIEDTKNVADMLRDQLVELATLQKAIVVDSIVEKEIVNKVIAEDKADERKTELSAMSMKELSAIKVTKAESNDNNSGTRQPASVQNPAFSNNGENTDSNKNNGVQKKNVNDYVNSIVNNMMKR